MRRLRAWRRWQRSRVLFVPVTTARPFIVASGLRKGERLRLVEWHRER